MLELPESICSSASQLIVLEIRLTPPAHRGLPDFLVCLTRLRKLTWTVPVLVNRLPVPSDFPDPQNNCLTQDVRLCLSQVNYVEGQQRPSSWQAKTGLRFSDPNRPWPDVLERLTTLRDLGLANHGFSDVPASIARLTVLKKLSLNSNYLTAAPAPLSDLRELQDLTLSENLLQEWPGHLSKLPKLTILGLNQNLRLPAPSTWDGRGWKSLKRVWAYGMPSWTALPAVLAELWATRTAVEIYDLRWTGFKAPLPDSAAWGKDRPTCYLHGTPACVDAPLAVAASACHCDEGQLWNYTMRLIPIPNSSRHVLKLDRRAVQVVAGNETGVPA